MGAPVSDMKTGEQPTAETLLSAFKTIGASDRRKHATVRCMVVLLAVERYRLAHGRWPDALAELTPAYLEEPLLDPYTGKPISYKRLDDGVLVYSVGPDETDDGGLLDRQNRIRVGTDLGYRLWDVSHRRQPPRPAAELPASPP